MDPVVPAWRSAAVGLFQPHPQWEAAEEQGGVEIQLQQPLEVTSLQERTIRRNKAIIRQALLLPALAVAADRVEVQYQVQHRVASVSLSLLAVVVGPVGQPVQPVLMSKATSQPLVNFLQVCGFNPLVAVVDQVETVFLVH